MQVEEGKILSGKVTGITKFGAFVELEGGETGLVHISEIANKFIRHPSEIVKVGDVVDVAVLDVDPAKKRISLSMKQARKET